MAYSQIVCTNIYIYILTNVNDVFLFKSEHHFKQLVNDDQNEKEI